MIDPKEKLEELFQKLKDAIDKKKPIAYIEELIPKPEDSSIIEFNKIMEEGNILVYAMKNNRPDIVKYFLGRNVKKQYEEKFPNPITYEVKIREIFDVVDGIVVDGIQELNTVMSYAIKHDNDEIVKFLYEEWGEEIDNQIIDIAINNASPNVLKYFKGLNRDNQAYIEEQERKAREYRAAQERKAREEANEALYNELATAIIERKEKLAEIRKKFAATSTVVEYSNKWLGNIFITAMQNDRADIVHYFFGSHINAGRKRKKRNVK